MTHEVIHISGKACERLRQLLLDQIDLLLDDPSHLYSGDSVDEIPHLKSLIELCDQVFYTTGFWEQLGDRGTKYERLRFYELGDKLGLLDDKSIDRC